MNVGVVGYGKMGSGIFRLLVGRSDDIKGITVFIRDKEKALEAGAKFFKSLERSLKRGGVSQEEFQQKRERIRFTHRIEDLGASDIVVETAVEDVPQKVELFHKLEEVINPTAILVSNTSSISLRALARELRHPERFCGLHFFYPLLLVDLVEVVRWDETPAGLVESLKDFCGRIERKPIVVQDAPGSMINAILAYYYVESLYMLEEGIALPSRIDNLARQYFYVGPCESMDVIGIDFFIEALKRAATPGSLLPIQWEGDDTELSEEITAGRQGFHIPTLFSKLITEERRGRKFSKGIYLYAKDKPVDDTAEFYVHPRWVRAVESTVDPDEFMSKRLLYSIFNGSIYSWKKCMSSLEEIDWGVKEVLHMEEGPFTMMRSLGKARVADGFDFLARYAGRRFEQPSLDFLA